PGTASPSKARAGSAAVSAPAAATAASSAVPRTLRVCLAVTKFSSWRRVHAIEYDWDAGRGADRRLVQGCAGRRRHPGRVGVRCGRSIPAGLLRGPYLDQHVLPAVHRLTDFVPAVGGKVVLDAIAICSHPQVGVLGIVGPYTVDRLQLQRQESFVARYLEADVLPATGQEHQLVFSRRAFGEHDVTVTALEENALLGQDLVGSGVVVVLDGVPGRLAGHWLGRGPGGLTACRHHPRQDAGDGSGGKNPGRYSV